MLPKKSGNIVRATIRHVSTKSTKQNVTAAVDVKEIYYQKLGSKVNQNENNIKPEGWDQAKPFKTIPGPRPLPIIGNIWRFFPFIGEYHNVQMVDMHRILRQKYGKVVYFGGIPAKRPMVFLYEPEDMEHLLRNEGPWPIRHGLPSFTYYRNHVRNDVFQGVDGLLSAQGEQWFHIRSMVNKILMQPRVAEMYVDSMDNVANGLIDNMRYFSNISGNKEMPEYFQNEIFKWTLESVGVITYNKRMGCLDRNLEKNSVGQKLISSAVEFFELMYKLDYLPSLWTVWSTKNWRRYVEILDFFTVISQKYIQECLDNSDPDPKIPDHERSVLERLIQDDKKIAVTMVTDMLIAGIDTTGRTMAAALYFLAKNPEKQQTLREELLKYMPNKNSPVTKEMLRESPYLKAVIKETSRMSPISIGHLRTTVNDLVLAGFQIPKGTDVLTINILPSLDEKYYIKAKEFIPERWLRSAKDEFSHKNVHPFVTLPFGFGPRSCVGKRIANLELEVGLSKVIRNFQLSWHHPDATFGTKLLYGIMDPVKVKVEEVEDNL